MLFFLLALVIAYSTNLHADPSEAQLSEAIASMRGIDPKGLSDARQKAKAKELGEAWKVLIGAGSRGVIALKEELKKINTRKEKDDHFKLGAAALLWHIGRFEEVQSIAAIWSGGVDLNASHPYVFYTAFEAAQTQDIRVLPMLTPLLGHHTGKLFIAQHYLTIQGPLFQGFIWGAFGSKGLPALNRVLQESTDDRVLASAIQLLARAQDRGAIDRIREIAINGTGIARSAAIQALGLFGHPQDFEFLASGIKNGRGMDLVVFASALYEYDDLRAVPLLIPLLSSPDKLLGNEVIASLTHLVTQEGITALEQCARDATDIERRNTCSKVISKLPKQSDPETSKANTAAQLRERADDKYRMKAGDRQLSHKELLKAAEEWKRNRSIAGGTYSWIEGRHVMAAATAADIPLLMDVAAACYTRLSDECLYEVRTIQELIQRLGRSRYRKDVGVCEKVEPL
jgi:hypothetical protein